ncbi:hypothetical protein BDR06DRAFT_1022700 [Suillus hirtellus]|nr:hypothetical protein BDR06DRAFT_1022700 [Suillus hirtellus]
MVWFHRFDETSTAHIRKALGMHHNTQGSWVLYIIVFSKLQPITDLSGPEFRDAWWQIINCHRILWEGGVYHRDISPSNLMYYRLSCGRVIGVLNDYDLSPFKMIVPEAMSAQEWCLSWQSICSHYRPSTTQLSTCTGTILNHSSGFLSGSVFGVRMANSVSPEAASTSGSK